MIRVIVRALVWICALEAVASAQKPPMGDSYAGRASDTGATGGVVNSSGGYSTSVPLDLPPTRDGTPIPFGIHYNGGHKAGAAGVGWDIPLSFIFVDSTIAHYKPQNNPDSTPIPLQRVVLSLNGEVIELVQQPFVGDDGNWPYWARKDHPRLEALHPSSDEWDVYDGDGHTYTFVHPDNVIGLNLWLLDSVSGPHGLIMKMSYNFTGVQDYEFTLDLVSIDYNFKSSDCPKNEILLEPNDNWYPGGVPIATAVMDGAVEARFSTVKDVRIQARSDCGSSLEVLREYDFTYTPDLDTQQPRLASVTVRGRYGTHEYDDPLPVANYQYGTVSVNGTDGGRALRTRTETVAVPTGPDTSATAKSDDIPDDADWRGFDDAQNGGFVDTQNLIDFNADGIPDLVYSSGAGSLQVAAGRVSSTGNSFDAPVTLGDTSMQVNEYLSGAALSGTDHPNVDARNREDVWRKVLDINGDGRLDIIDAAVNPGYWTVYLNTPSDGPSGVEWATRYIPTAAIKQELEDRGHVIETGDAVPLERHFVGLYSFDLADAGGSDCYNGDLWVPSGTSPSDYYFGEQSDFTEWTFMDMNGDGYPDLVYNTQPVRYTLSIDQNVTTGGHAASRCTAGPVGDDGSSNSVNAFYDVAGIALSGMRDSAGNVFSAPMTILYNWPSGGGVAYYVPGLNQGAAFMDVNGDGIPDRYDTQSLGSDGLGDGLGDEISYPVAYVGTGAASAYAGAPAAFSNTRLTFPTDANLGAIGVMALGQLATGEDIACGDGGDGSLWYRTMTATGLRDVTGDGIPDLVTSGGGGIIDCDPSVCELEGALQGPLSQYVYPGTGAGFSSIPIAVLGRPVEVATTNRASPGSAGAVWPPELATAAALPMSMNQVERCDSPGIVDTFAGVYDVDGDGFADFVLSAGAGSPYTILKLLGSDNTDPYEAGQLVSIDNGYGASTQLTSAKQQDSYTAHAVPFPEVVVSSVTTTVGSAGAMAPTYYAYGDASLFYGPFDERFSFPGYLRTLSLTSPNPEDGLQATSQVNLTIRLGEEAPECDGSGCFGSATDQFDRQMEVGRTAAVANFGAVGLDPWQLLATDPFNDPLLNSMQATQYTTSLHDFGLASAPPLDCIDYQYPYDFDTSLALGSFYNTCASVGFSYSSDIGGIRGDPTSGSANVETETTVTEDPEYGLPTEVHYFGDTRRNDDDICVSTTYAAPDGSGSPVLTAPVLQQYGDCIGQGAIFMAQHWLYDGLPSGQVSARDVTGTTVDRYDLSGYNVELASNTLFTASYDGTGSLQQVTQTRQPDGATRQTTFTYDAFDLVPTSSTTSWGSSHPIQTTVTPDPLSSVPLVSQDANGTQISVTYDGFDRPLTTSIAPPTGSGTSGLLSTTNYDDFSGSDGLGRRIVTKTYDTPVAEGSSAPDHTSTAYFDELGRPTKMLLDLGASYTGSDEFVYTAYRTYDNMGRVAFEADPFPASAGSASAYGTSKFYRLGDGRPYCFVRASGQQASSTATSDDSTETFPTCFYYSYSDGLEYLGVSKPDANETSSPQTGVINYKVLTAIGRPVASFTQQGSTPLEYATYVNDRLGNISSMTRYTDPVGLSGAVTTTWTHDSLDNVIRVQLPTGPPQTTAYNSWNEPTTTTWTSSIDDVEHSLVATYDALGRVTHREEQAGGSADPESQFDYEYDTSLLGLGSDDAPEIGTQTNLVGRLSAAYGPAGRTYFSYDGYGGLNGRADFDEEGTRYVERYQRRPDGGLGRLTFNLPDDEYVDENVDYTYDSAARVATIAFDGANIYSATNFDSLGRLRQADWGSQGYAAYYAPSGRRLLQSVTVSYNELYYNGFTHTYQTESLARQVQYSSYDALGRELARVEALGNSSCSGCIHVNSSIPYSQTYDPLGRLSRFTSPNGSGEPVAWSYAYDSIGNIDALTGSDIHGSDGLGANVMTFTVGDLDQMCFVGYAGVVGNRRTRCNVSYDDLGNVTSEPARTGARALTYFATGQVKSIDDGESNASFRYDPFNSLQELDVEGPTNDNRRDRHYGRFVTVSGVTSQVISRNIPGPGGIIASLRGADGILVYDLAEARGARWTFSGSNEIQNIAYQPFGEAISDDTPTDPNYTHEQFNGGDDLAAFNLIHIGARLYDPVIGRFLSRDPITMMGRPGAANPYSFANNDPINATDPTGADYVDSYEGGYCEGECDGYNDDGVLLGQAVTYVSGTGGFASTTYPLPEYNAAGELVHPEVQYSFPMFNVTDVNSAAGFDYPTAPPPTLPPPGKTSPWDAPWEYGPPLPSTFAAIMAADDPDGTKYGPLAPMLSMGQGMMAGFQPEGAAGEILEGIEALDAADGEGAAASVVVRGTSEGFPGSPGLQSIGITPASTNPYIGTLFGIHAQEFGNGVLLIAESEGLPIGEGNVLSLAESEVGIEMSPSEFAAQAQSFSIDAARSAFSQMGIVLPGALRTVGALDSEIASAPSLTSQQITMFLKNIGYLK